MTKTPPFIFSLSADQRRALLTAMLVVAVLALMPGAAHAQSAGFDVPFIRDFGCGVVKWMKGPLAVLIFVIVLFATLVMGLIAKMDWAKVVSLAVIFGLITALGGFLANNQYMQSMAGLSGCLQ